MGTSWLAGTWDDHRQPPSEYFRKSWVLSPIIHSSFHDNINYFELISACLAILVWCQLFSGCEVIIVSDNSSTVSYLNRGTSKNLQALQWLKLVFYACCDFDFVVRAQRVPGVQNTAADALGRLTDGASFCEIFMTQMSLCDSFAILTDACFYRYLNIRSAKDAKKITAFSLCKQLD